MLISHDRGFLFIHIPKTAGSSVLQALAPYCVQRPRSIWRRRMIWLGPINRLGNLHHAVEFPVHTTSATVRRCIPRSLYDRLFKFAFIRNPWDAMLSQYIYIRDTTEHHLHRTVSKMSGFDEFLDWDLRRHNRNQHQFITDRRGRFLVDSVGRFENLHNDFAAVCERLNLQVSLPHANKSNHRDYREYYTEHTRELVARHFARDIAMFGYAFDPVRSRARSVHYHPLPYAAWNPRQPAHYDSGKIRSLAYWTRVDMVDTSDITDILANPDQSLTAGPSLIKNDPATTVGAANCYIVKRFNPRHALDPVKDLFRSSKARRALRLSGMLESVGIPTAAVVAAVDARTLGWLKRCYQITRRLDGTVELPEWKGDLDLVSRNLGLVIARLHNAGLAHRDLKPTNILVSPDGQPYLVDLEGLRYVGVVPSHVAAHNLARLLRGPGEVKRLAPRQQRIFLRQYCQARGISPHHLVRRAYPIAIARRQKQRVAVTLLVIAGLSAAGFGIWDAWVKDRVCPKRWGVVSESRIFRSGQLHPALVEKTLRDNGIKVIVDLTNDRDLDPYQIAEAETAARLGIEHDHYPLKGDGTGKIRHYAEAIARIHQASLSNQPVLVHCAAGSQRTGGVIASYRLLVDHAPVADVLKEMEQYDWDPVKNRILLDYLNAHMAELAALLVEEGVIEKPPKPLPVLAP